MPKKLEKEPNPLKINGITTLIFYKRDKDLNPVGTVVAVLINNEVRLGWSKVGVRKTGELKDTPDKKYGIKIAMNRAILEDGVKSVPSDMAELVDAMVVRAKKYFQGVNLRPAA